MKRFIEFTKLTAAGNDFIVVDNRLGKLSGLANAKKWCDRKYSIGGDGLLLLEKSKKANFMMRIINSDGSEAQMCGNGIRCIAKYANDKKISGKQFTIQTLAGLIGVQIKGAIIKAKMVEPKDLRLGFTILLDGKEAGVNFVNTGVPHAVIFDKFLEQTDVEVIGRKIRYHEQFKPRGTNANFVKVGSVGTIEVRTYERGVEGETMACGTGSTASALVTAALQGWKSPVTVKTRGGERLKVYFSRKGDLFQDVYLEGPVQTCFEGRVEL